MNTPQNPSDVADLLRRHAELLEELFDVVREEARILGGGGMLDSKGLNERKRAILERITVQVEAMRVSARPADPDRNAQRQLAALKTRVLQILELQSANEKLLLKLSLPGNRGAATLATVPPGLLQRIYLNG